MFFQNYKFGQTQAMWKLADDANKIKYQGASHSGKTLTLKATTPNAKYIVGPLSLPRVLTWEEGRYTIKGEIVQNPSKWTIPADFEEEEIIIESPQEVFDLSATNIDFTNMFKAVAVDDINPAKKQRTTA